MQVFLRSPRKRKAAGKIPALALDCEQRWLAAQMMRCVPAGIARPARREARSPPAQQAPFPASSHPLLQCVPISPPSTAGGHTTSSSFNREGARAPRPAFPPPSPFLQRERGAGAVPRSPRGEGRLRPPAPSPPCRSWAASNRATRTAPRSPRPGGARGPGGRGGDMM